MNQRIERKKAIYLLISAGQVKQKIVNKIKINLEPFW